MTLSGFTDLPASIGTYTRQGTLNGYSYWRNAAGMFLYFHPTGAWVLDVDTDPTGVQDYVGAETSFPPSGALWAINTGSRPTILCADAGRRRQGAV